jgi:hypothetical protein
VLFSLGMYLLAYGLSNRDTKAYVPDIPTVILDCLCLVEREIPAAVAGVTSHKIQ